MKYFAAVETDLPLYTLFDLAYVRLLCEKSKRRCLIYSCVFGGRGDERM